MLFHGSFSVVSGELPKIGTTGIELWFSDSFLSILFVCQGNISLNQKTPQKTTNRLETISLQKNHFSSKQVPLYLSLQGQKKQCREGMSTQADKSKVAFSHAMLSQSFSFQEVR